MLDRMKQREKSVELAGNWEFSFDGKSWRGINVPFCPQSRLSGIGHTDFIRECYYRRKFFAEKTGDRLFLHFGAVDYRAVVRINGKYVGSHTGGYTPFSFDITDFVTEGENGLELSVYDEDEASRASGKQSRLPKPCGCIYTRTTGIWQPVWLEYVPEKRVEDFRFYPDIREGAVTVDLRVNGSGNYRIQVFFEGEEAGQVCGEIRYRREIRIPLRIKKLWRLGEGNLYDVRISFETDEVRSYFGLREVGYDGYDFLLNGEKVFQKLVLDQGFYPDGIYTAPSEADMEKDIELALALGFNGARLHQKVFDPRFLYLCDKKGYIVWGEFPSWGVDCTDLSSFGQFLREWEEVLRRDFNHPPIVTWSPLNEVYEGADGSGKRNDFRFIDSLCAFTKAYDTTRPCVDSSGGHHGEHTDLFDFHAYAAAEDLKSYLDGLEERDELNVPLLYATYGGEKYKKGKPVHFSEYGGVALVGGEPEGDLWSYGRNETDGDSFVERYRALTEPLFGYKKLSGFCYTQLYDIEQEQNGFYRYDRSDKLSEAQKEKIREINGGDRKNPR